MYEGEGKIVGPHEVEVTQLDGTKICYSAKHILIATGSRAVIPDIPGKVSACSSLCVCVCVFLLYVERNYLMLPLNNWYLMLSISMEKFSNFCCLKCF